LVAKLVDCWVAALAEYWAGKWVALSVATKAVPMVEHWAAHWVGEMVGWTAEPTAVQKVHWKVAPLAESRVANLAAYWAVCLVEYSAVNLADY
jgi:hypothetical protein